MKKNFKTNELEILVELVDEELGETQSLYDENKDINISKRLNILKNIKSELVKNDEIPNEVKLGVEIGKLVNNGFQFEDTYKFITRQTTSIVYADELFNLYDKFGFKEVNNIIISLGNEKFKEVKQDE